MLSDRIAREFTGVLKASGSGASVMSRCAFLSRLGSVAYVAVTHDEKGGNLPSEIDGNKLEWARIEASHGEIFSLISTADMERDLHEGGIHITETRTKRRGTF